MVFVKLADKLINSESISVIKKSRYPYEKDKLVVTIEYVSGSRDKFMMTRAGYSNLVYRLHMNYPYGYN